MFKVLFIYSIDLNLQVLNCSIRLSITKYDYFYVWKSFFLEMYVFITVLMLSWKSVNIFSRSSNYSSILRIRSVISSRFGSFCEEAFKQCSRNYVTSIESWFLWGPLMVKHFEHIMPLAWHLGSMQTKVGTCLCRWQLYGLMNSLNDFEKVSVSFIENKIM